jgi:hypothetical protein
MLCVLAGEIHSNGEENVKSVKKKESEEKKVYKGFSHKTMTVCVICILLKNDFEKHATSALIPHVVLKSKILFFEIFSKITLFGVISMWVLDHVQWGYEGRSSSKHFDNLIGKHSIYTYSS